MATTLAAVVAETVEVDFEWARGVGAYHDVDRPAGTNGGFGDVSFDPGASKLRFWIDSGVCELPVGGAGEVVFFDDAVGFGRGCCCAVADGCDARCRTCCSSVFQQIAASYFGVGWFFLAHDVSVHPIGIVSGKDITTYEEIKLACFAL